MATHGQSSKKNGETAEYAAWRSMKERCLKPQHPAYKHYGGRGVLLCRQWKYSFENFFKDMGKKPTPKHSLDRINNDGNYEPDNCRWATTAEQSNNRRDIRKLDFGDGLVLNMKQTIAQWGITRRIYLNLFNPAQLHKEYLAHRGTKQRWREKCRAAGRKVT